MTTITTLKVGRWQRNAAGVLFAASLAAIALNVWGLVVSTLLFGAGGSAFTTDVPESTATQIGGSEQVTAYFTEAVVSAHDLGFWPQAWLSVARILWCLVWITVALCVLAFSYGAYHGEVFGRRLPALMTVAAIAVGAGGSVANGLQMWGTTTAMADLSEHHPDFELTSWSASADPLWTILSGLLLALLAIVFRSGTQFKRDTEGLV